MPKQTYASLQSQIAKLNAQAEMLREEEIAGVVTRIKEAIKVYGLSVGDLFDDGMVKSASKTQAGSQLRTRSKVANPSAKYADGKGGIWVGRGPRPSWLREALAAGRSLEEFAVGRSPTLAAVPVGKLSSKKAKQSGQHAGGISYRDASGKTWGGRGPKPKWLAEAIAGGKSLEDFRV